MSRQSHASHGEISLKTLARNNLVNEIIEVIENFLRSTTNMQSKIERSKLCSLINLFMTQLKITADSESMIKDIMIMFPTDDALKSRDDIRSILESKMIHNCISDACEQKIFDKLKNLNVVINPEKDSINERDATILCLDVITILFGLSRLKIPRQATRFMKSK